MSYLSAAALVRSDADHTGAHPPEDPEQRMHYAWANLAQLTLELAVRNGSDLASLRERIKSASNKSIRILECARVA